ncbi:N-acetylmuramoyl-L-alanine amidase [Aureimonas leprariae]|uniref:N-acetylmuramoyl-L-alanine amidase n=1 Tax=Plantimonas leprariae TaxID=2615207 RepID=A0A7V7PR73_9HYPH|nr:N-acetylmuramoyl-L-alanine amidase [Aureimonas leprariae]KAB0680954.1 N-acetylmuramoyl-L-alanine amidase [Aureimonas leprariae]
MPSPNRNERRGAGPDILLLHYTGMEDGEKAAKWLTMPVSQVSCHYLVHENGRIVQFVPETERAWHAGAGSWQGRADINSRSVGIEIVNPGHEFGYRAFPDAQVSRIVALCLGILSRWPIEPRNVLAHSDTAPSRKQDPGELFPWDRLHAAGIGHLVQPEPIRGSRFLALGDEGAPVDAWQELLVLYGYEVERTARFDEATRFATLAFQRHFRPERVDGVADVSTVATLHRLLQALPPVA